WVFHDRTLETAGEAGRVDFVVLHPDRGIALVAVLFEGEEFVEPSARDAMCAVLVQLGFIAQFGALPPVVVVPVDPQQADTAAETLAAALDTTAAPSVADPDWVEWLADRLARPGDLETTPAPSVPERPVSAGRPDAASDRPGWR